jgi:lipopolysaccharide/colanic/teichoic acid biosynthesis glycosyltransferase
MIPSLDGKPMRTGQSDATGKTFTADFVPNSGLFVKSAVDMTVSCIGLLVLALPMACIALAVLLSVGRPVLFAQQRAGKHGVSFEIRKFRTMTDATDDSGALLPDNERETWATRILRRFRLDELPQFWSILLGEMSLVGPRPLLPATINSMGRLGAIRGLVKPGMTGWAQLNGGPLLDEADKIALDIWYVAHRSLMFDVRILLQTGKIVVCGDRVNQKNVLQARQFVSEISQGATT